MDGLFLRLMRITADESALSRINRSFPTDVTLSRSEGSIMLDVEMLRSGSA